MRRSRSLRRFSHRGEEAWYLRVARIAAEAGDNTLYLRHPCFPVIADTAQYHSIGIIAAYLCQKLIVPAFKQLIVALVLVYIVGIVCAEVYDYQLRSACEAVSFIGNEHICFRVDVSRNIIAGAGIGKSHSRYTYHAVVCAKLPCGYRRIGQISVFLCGIKTVRKLALVAVACGYGVAEKFDIPVRRSYSAYPVAAACFKKRYSCCAELLLGELYNSYPCVNGSVAFKQPVRCFLAVEGKALVRLGGIVKVHGYPCPVYAVVAVFGAADECSGERCAAEIKAQTRAAVIHIQYIILYKRPADAVAVKLLCTERQRLGRCRVIGDSFGAVSGFG